MADRWRRVKIAVLLGLVCLPLLGSHFAGAALDTTNPGSPYNHDTWIAFSPDGREVSQGHAKLVVHHASVPDVCVLPDGRGILYYVDAAALDERRCVLSARFIDPQGQVGPVQHVQIQGENSIGVDPEAILLPDGRIRLYYVARRRDPSGSKRGPREIRSALSSDGVNFVREPGVRFGGEGVVDPAVVQLPSGEWKMYYTILDRTGHPPIRSASSRDGLSFTADPGIRYSHGGSPGAMVLPDGRVRLYIGSDKGLTTRISDDGLDFQPEGKSAQGMATLDPSVDRLPNGAYLMTFKSFRPGVQIQHGVGHPVKPGGSILAPNLSPAPRQESRGQKRKS